MEQGDLGVVVAAKTVGEFRGDAGFAIHSLDLDPRSQRAIIRVVEEGIYYRLGENIRRESCFRLITGTNQPDEVLRERLAPDFLDRIRDIEIALPPLRDCREDLAWMWWGTWCRVARESGAVPGTMEDAAPRIVEFLSSQPLPGNWRDLRRLAVRLAVLMTDGRIISGAELERVLSAFRDAEQAPPPSAPGESPENPRLASKRDENQLHKLEVVLGPGLPKLWEACRAGRSPKLALNDLLGNRHRAQRAAEFVARTFPDKWQQLSGKRPQQAPEEARAVRAQCAR